MIIIIIILAEVRSVARGFSKMSFFSEALLLYMCPRVP